MIKLNIGNVTDAASEEISDVALASAIKESRWQKGNAFINGREIKVERKWSLDEWEYRLNGTLIGANQIEMYMPTEFMEWRDG